MEETISKVDNLFAKVYRELSVSNKDYDETTHGPGLHRLTSLHISIKLFRNIYIQKARNMKRNIIRILLLK